MFRQRGEDAFVLSPHGVGATPGATPSIRRAPWYQCRSPFCTLLVKNVTNAPDKMQGSAKRRSGKTKITPDGLEFRVEEVP